MFKIMEQTPKKYLLGRYDNCYALLANEEVKVGNFMANSKNIYKAPEIDGFIGFLKVVACSVEKGDLPLIDMDRIEIPVSIKSHGFWNCNVLLGSDNEIKVQDGFVELIKIISE